MGPGKACHIAGFAGASEGTSSAQRGSSTIGQEEKGHHCPPVVAAGLVADCVSITPYAGTWYQWGHGLSSIFKGYSIRPSLCSRALCCGPACALLATCSEERPWNKPSRTASPPSKATSCKRQACSQPWGTRRQPNGGPAKDEHPCSGRPENALTMEISLPDKAGKPVGQCLIPDRHHWWLPGADWPQVRSGEWWTSRVPDPHQWWELPVPEMSGP